MRPHDQRAGYVLVNVLLLLATVYFFSSCTTFQKAFQKYGTNVVDTTLVTVKQVVPHDSVILQLVTDTTTVYKEIRQGRARIIYQRNPNTTLIKADCDSIVVEKKVPQYITKQVWGIDPVWKERADRWKLLSIGLGALLIVGAVAVHLFTRVYQLNVKIAKRNGTTGAEA